MKQKLILASAILAAFAGSMAPAEDAKPDNEVSPAPDSKNPDKNAPVVGITKTF